MKYCDKCGHVTQEIRLFSTIEDSCTNNRCKACPDYEETPTKSTWDHMVIEAAKRAANPPVQQGLKTGSVPPAQGYSDAWKNTPKLDACYITKNKGMEELINDLSNVYWDAVQTQCRGEMHGGHE